MLNSTDQQTTDQPLDQVESSTSPAKTTPKKKVVVETWGCQMNVADSEKMLALLQAQEPGNANEYATYEFTTDESEADLFLLNTCHIREKAKQKVLSRLGILKQFKTAKPSMRIAVAGCVAQAEGKRLLEEAPQIDVLLGPGRIADLPRLLAERQSTGRSVMAVGFPAAEKKPDLQPPTDHAHDETPLDTLTPYAAFPEESAPPTPTLTGKNEVSRYVTIIQGCDNFCTFCVVPFTRGREVSLRPGAVISEVKHLLRHGASEVMLLGQNVNSYGLDLVRDQKLPPSADGPFVDLMRAVLAEPELKRLRFTTSNPHDFTKPLADLFAENPKMGRYMHLPVQSGNDRILERMKRKVTVETYRERIKWLRDAIPDMAISTDLIVGFPGETDEEFADTIKLVEEVKFAFVFSFKYSPRRNTAATRFLEQVPEAVKDARLKQLNTLQDAITLKHHRDEIGQTRDVLFLYESKKEPGCFYGRTEHFRLVRVISDLNLVGQCLPVKIIDANKTAMVGTLN